MKFLKYRIDDMPVLLPIDPADPPDVKQMKEKNNWTSRNRIKRSVNGFIMETYCELLGRPCTQAEMQGHLDEWPDPQGSHKLGVSVVIEDGQITAGVQSRLDILHKASMTPGKALLPENAQAGDEMPTPGGIPDPDYDRRLALTKSIMLSDAYIRGNLQRMINNVLHIHGQEVGSPTGEIDRFFERYKAAVYADLAPLTRVDAHTGKAITVTPTINHRAEFGRELYAELCHPYHMDPIGNNSFARDEPIVFSYFFSWYISPTQTDTQYIPGSGPFDVWAPHPHIKPRRVEDIYLGGREWENVPGSVHGRWAMDLQESKEFLRQNFSDAVEAGIDVLIFDTWIRPGATVYPWMPEGGCQNWWECQGGDSRGLGWLRLAVEVLNEMKRDRLHTPKLGFGIETPQFGPVSDNGTGPLKGNMDPIHWAACAMQTWDPVLGTGYSADWGKDEHGNPEDRDPDSDQDERGRFRWPFKFPEAQRYLASMLRTIFQEVPLEHLAFIERRPIISIWQATDNISPAYDPLKLPAKTVSRLFSEEFYGLHLWALANPQWWDRDAGNDFVYTEPIDPGHPENSIEVGNECPWCGSADEYSFASDFKTVALTPAVDMTRKRWRPHPQGKVSGDQHTREFGMRYIGKWRDFLKDPRAPEVKRVVIETFNELYEGTGICRSREYGMAYLAITRGFVDFWKSGASLPAQRQPLLREISRYVLATIGSAGAARPGLGQSASRTIAPAPGGTVSLEDILKHLHPPRVFVDETVGQQGALAEPEGSAWCVNRAYAQDLCTQYCVPISVCCEGTGKYEGEALLWIKFYPQNYTWPDHWKVFTNPDVDELEKKGGVVRGCNLVHITRNAQTETIWGCILPTWIEPWPYSGLPPKRFYEYDDRMRKPWDFPPEDYFCVYRIQAPPLGITYVMLVNVVIPAEFEDQEDVIFHLGGSYLESGGAGGADASWVHLESTMHVLNVQRKRSLYPFHLKLTDLPSGYEVMPLPGLVSPIQGLRWTSRACGS